MRISVRTAGNLAKYLPPGARAGQAELNVAADTTLSALFTLLRLPDDRSYLTSVNDELVTGDAQATLALQPGDRVMLMPLLKGG